MKKFTAMLMALTLTILALLACAPALAAGDCTIQLNVDFDQNAYFSRYDADVYLDGNYVDTVVHGRKSTVTMTGVSTGSHEITFCNPTSRSVNGSFTFTNGRSVELDCNIHAYNDHIYVGSLQLHGLLDARESSMALARAGEHTFSYEVSFTKNEYFSKYDVELYIDDEPVDTFVQGNKASGEITLRDGLHNLTFYKVGGHSVYGSIRLTTVADTNFKCRISAYNSEVTVSNVATNAGK